MAAIYRNLCVFLIVVASVAGCRNSEDINAYLRYRECAGSGCFKYLSPSEKTAVFFGAMEIHPPDVSIDALLAQEDLEYLRALQVEIERRGGSYEAYSFVSAIKLKQQRGEISDEQVEELQLVPFCKKNDDLNLCSSLVR